MPWAQPSLRRLLAQWPRGAVKEDKSSELGGAPDLAGIADRDLTDALVASSTVRGREQRHRAGLASIDARIAEIDKTLARDFPDYAALTNPAPLSIGQVQAELRDDEVLALFLDIVEFEQTPEETFVWAVSKTESRLLRIDLGTMGLIERVTALRCGLDARLWDDAADWPETTEEGVQQRRAQIERRQICEDLSKPTAKEVVGWQCAGCCPRSARAHERTRRARASVRTGQGKRLIIVASGRSPACRSKCSSRKPPPTAIPGKLADYRTAAWLGAEQTITGAARLARSALRLCQDQPSYKSYLGIGNP